MTENKPEGKREFWIEMQEYFMTEYDENGQLIPIKESSEWKIPVNHRGWITIAEKPIENSVHVIEYAEVERLKSQLQIAKEALKFYADEDNWSTCTDQTTSHMIGPDDHDVIVPFSKEFIAGRIARIALKKLEES